MRQQRFAGHVEVLLGHVAAEAGAATGGGDYGPEPAAELIRAHWPSSVSASSPPVGGRGRRCSPTRSKVSPGLIMPSYLGGRPSPAGPPSFTLLNGENAGEGKRG